MNPKSRYEQAYTWVCRACALIGFGFLLAGPGFDAPWGAYILLLGLFFGPEVVKGQIQINRNGGKNGGGNGSRGGGNGN